MKPAPTTHSFFVSVHIPKTAGTTLGLILNRVFRYKVLLDYADHSEYDKPNPLIREHRTFIAQYYNGIHGHFNVLRHFTVFPTAKYIACVRHPVERIISQYLHELNDDGSDSYFHKDIKSGRMSIVDFAEQDGVGNGMHLHVKGISLEDFDLLLLSENMLQSLFLLNYVIGDMSIPKHFGKPPLLPRENTRAQRSIDQEFDQQTRGEIYLRAPLDVEIYRKASELFAEKARKYT